MHIAWNVRPLNLASTAKFSIDNSATGQGIRQPEYLFLFFSKPFRGSLSSPKIALKINASHQYWGAWHV